MCPRVPPRAEGHRREGRFHVKNTYHAAVIIETVAISAFMLLTLAPAPASASAPTQVGALVLDDQAKAARAKRIAETFERNARVLTVFDRRGKVVSTVGERAIYNQPAFSPDRKRLAVIKTDLGNETEDIWVLDVATGNSTRITSSQKQEWVRALAWSPDGSQLAFSALRSGYFGLYRKASNGEGTEELLYQHPGQITLTDWSMDGRFLSFSSRDLSGGTLYALPLGGDGERKPIVLFRGLLPGSRLSPDSRVLAYVSNQSGENEVYVRLLDSSAGAEATPAAGPWQVSDQGGPGPAYWRRDGKELFYLAADQGVMAVEASTAPPFTFGKPRLMFRLSEAVPVNGAVASVSRDGQRVVVAVPYAPTLQQITVLDRQGKVLSKVGELGRYQDPAFSPDGKRVAVVRRVPRTGIWDIWTFDVASGKGTPVVIDTFWDYAPIWSPDGSQVAYVSERGNFRSIYRKAWDGTGNEEQLFQYTPGADIELTDWSSDGKFLTFFPSAGGFLILVVPLRGDQKAIERQAIEWLREEYDVAQPRFSPDTRFMAYLSNEIDSSTWEVNVRAFDAGKPEAGAGAAKPLQVSTAGARGMIFWRQDGKELYYLTSDWEVMAVEVTTRPTFQAGIPRLLFKLPGPVSTGSPLQWKNVSRDGQRFVFTISVPAGVSAR